MLFIVAHNGGDTQTLKLRADTTIERGMEMVDEAIEGDVCGCDLFELWQDEELIYAKERPLCD